MARKSILSLNAHDNIGLRFNRLIIIGITNKRRHRMRIYECLCDCGNKCLAVSNDLTSGKKKSCGCLQRENRSKKENIEKALQTRLELGLSQPPDIAIASKIWRQLYKDGDISLNEFYTLSQNECFYCGALPSNRRSLKGRTYSATRKEVVWTYNGLDRIDNTYGHIKGNVVPCCKACNVAKNNRTQEGFYNWIERIYNRKKES